VTAGGIPQLQDVDDQPVTNGSHGESPSVPSGDALLKTDLMRRAAIDEVYALAQPSAEEIEQALVLIRERRIAEIEAQKLLEASRSSDGFQHYFLANPKYPYERILIPGTHGQFYAFYRGRILIDTPQKEALIRTACAGHIYDEDLSIPKKCKICQTQWFSSEALAECQLGH
jgi:hypothetical protein